MDRTASTCPEIAGPQQHSLPRNLIVLAVWTATLMGLIEGAGLLLFQRINWERWGEIVHVSARILWLSPLVDVVFFLVLLVPLTMLTLVTTRERTLQVAAFTFSALAIYDWAVLTERLDHRACVLLAIGVGAVVSRWFVKRQSGVLSFVRTTLPFVLGGAFVVFVATYGGAWWTERQALKRLPPAAPNTPNVLVIVVDTLRADHLSTYGYSQPTSPNLDRIAKEGTLFENAISTSSWSLPSHASMLTGLYPFEHGVKIRRMPLFATPRLGDYPTLGEAMQALGYRTGAFSANRIYFPSSLGFSQGFMHFEDYFQSPSDMFIRTVLGREFVRDFMYLPRKINPKRIFDSLGAKSFLDRDEEGAPGQGGAYSLRKRADVVNAELLHWIDGSPGRPFFAFINYFDVHNPYGGPMAKFPKNMKSATERTELYDKGIRYEDKYIGELFAALGQRGLRDNTLIIITSDHGESLWQHGLATHGKALYRELIHVPLIVLQPHHEASGLRVGPLVSTASIPATVLSLIAPETHNPFPSPSFAALLRDPEANSQPVLLSEVDQEQNSFKKQLDSDAMKSVITSFDGPMKSVATSEWHLILHKSLGGQLYKWKEDPEESKNLINTPEGKSVEAQLVGQMDDLLEERPSISSKVPFSPVPMPGSRVLAVPSKMTLSEKDLNNRFLLRATGGDQITLEVRSTAKRSHLDPIIAIMDNKGKVLSSCRDLSDDFVSSPGVPDPTPGMYDDVCRNAGLSPQNGGRSHLEILVPGNKGVPTDLVIEVLDWDGSRSLGTYELSAAPGKQVSGLIQ